MRCRCSRAVLCCLLLVSAASGFMSPPRGAPRKRPGGGQKSRSWGWNQKPKPPPEPAGFKFRLPSLPLSELSEKIDAVPGAVQSLPTTLQELPQNVLTTLQELPQVVRPLQVLSGFGLAIVLVFGTVFAGGKVLPRSSTSHRRGSVWFASPTPR